ncbi:discoidin domain-containing protein [Paenibacillus sp. GCM10023248]|nr:discoidin domain-containing protein [Paenibacillus sp. MAHUQ-63]
MTFDISDVTASGDVTNITTSPESPLSVKAHLIDKRRSMTYKAATLEKDRFRLDGSFSFADDVIANNEELGWSSSDICDAFGVFATPLTISFDFGSNHSSAGLTITFDQVNGEYAVDFDMTAYDAGGAVIATTSVTGNTDIIAVPIGQLYNYRKVSVIIRKWSKPNRRARVFEVDFGFVKQYTDDNLVNLSSVEEMDLLTGKLPSAEFKFTIDNSDRLFNILNPTGFYKYLQQRQQVIGEIGLDTGGGNFEYIPIGNYLLQEWQSDEGSLTATFTARTNLDTMASFVWNNSAPASQSLASLARYIFFLAGISNYWIDPALENITTNSVAEKVNYRDLLQMIAIAGGANIYVTRDGKITLKCNKTRKVRYIRDTTNGSTFNNAGHWVEIQAVNSSGTNIALGKPVTTSFVPVNSPSLITDGNTASENWCGQGGLGNVTVDLGAVYDIETVKVWHYYADGRTYHNTKTEISADGVTWKTVFDSAISGEYAETSAGRTYAMETVLGDMTPVDSADFDNMYTEPQIALDKAIKRVEVTYWTDLSTSGFVGVNHPVNTVGDTLKLEKNTLINTSARAQAVADWLMAQLAYRATYSVRWRGNPALELNDVLSMENTYGSTMNAYVTKNEIEYAGYLTVKTQAKGGVN